MYLDQIDGCSMVKYAIIFYDCNNIASELFVPNAFTPDDNHINNFFGSKGIHIQEFKMSIFNRWGDMIYFTEDIKKGWDGNLNGKPCKQDVYLYKIRFVNWNNELQIQTGKFTLLRR